MEALNLHWNSEYTDVSNCNDFVRNVANGLESNLALKEFGIYLRGPQSVDLRPLFSASAACHSRLEELTVFAPHLLQDSTEQIALALNEHYSQLKTLFFLCETDDRGFLQLLSGVEVSASLKDVTIFIQNILGIDTIQSLGIFLSKVTLQKLMVVATPKGGDPHWFEQDVWERIRCDILRGMKSNTSLESLRLLLPIKGQWEFEKLDTKLVEYCNRNAIARAARAMSDCHLPLSALPRVFEAVERLSDSDEDYRWLSSTVLYSGIRRVLQSSEKCHETKISVLGTASSD
jgi:hypothetical protein